MKDHDHLVAELLSLEPIKTWSLLVTLFGDLREQDLSGKDVRAFLEPIGVKPEAIRVALHRLKKEGWVTSEKVGREGLYSLTEFGRSETTTATKDIYRHDPKYLGAEVLVTAGSSKNALEEPCCRVGEQIIVVPKGHAHEFGNHLKITMPQDDAPLWFHEGLVGRQTLSVGSKLGRIAEGLETKDPPMQHIRLLVLHRWRKLALRPSVWLHVALFPDGVLANCHQRVIAILSRAR